MIVKQHNKGWEIISQYAHGLLAGKIAAPFQNLIEDNIWIDLLTSIIEHDDNLPNFNQEDHITIAGAPLDFTLQEKDIDSSYLHATKVYNNSIQKSQFIALMVGRHLEFLFKGKTKGHKQFSEFFENVRSERKTQLNLYDLNADSLEKYYDIMRFCDRCSLIICQGLIPSNGRKIEINKTIDNKEYFIMSTGEDKLRVTPWPFAVKNFKVQYESRIVEQLKFNNDRELENQLEQSDVIINSVEISE